MLASPSELFPFVSVSKALGSGGRLGMEPSLAPWFWLTIVPFYLLPYTPCGWDSAEVGNIPHIVSVEYRPKATTLPAATGLWLQATGHTRALALTWKRVDKSSRIAYRPQRASFHPEKRSHSRSDGYTAFAREPRGDKILQEMMRRRAPAHAQVGSPLQQDV